MPRFEAFVELSTRCSINSALRCKVLREGRCKRGDEIGTVGKKEPVAVEASDESEAMEQVETEIRERIERKEFPAGACRNMLEVLLTYPNELPPELYFDFPRIRNLHKAPVDFNLSG